MAQLVRNVMSHIEKFHRLNTEYPNWSTIYEVYQRDDPTFRRIPCIWQENVANRHEYHATVNIKTGELYLDCRKRKIFVKHLVLSVLRPLNTCMMTIWHASIIAPLAVEILAVIRGNQSIRDLGINTAESLADIIRTPLYGLAITVVHVAAIILAPISPNSLYKTREIAGKLERKMLRVESILHADAWLVVHCFSPVSNISIRRPETFAKQVISFRRNHSFIFNDCGKILPENKTYISAAKP